MTPSHCSSLLEDAPGVRHAFFTRRGGVSKGLYESLNLGRGSADDPDAIAQNRRRVASTFDVNPEDLLICNQIHSKDVLFADAAWDGAGPSVDGVVTNRPKLVCCVLAADCAPVLLVDAQARVIAATHAGWRGALTGVIETTVRTMEAAGADASRIIAAVGPCIGPKSYEVGEDFLDRFTSEFPSAIQFFAPGLARGKRWFDLPAFVLWRLEQAGVTLAHWIGHDTYANEIDFFSNRRAFKRGEPDYGRLLSAIMLEA